MISTYLILSDQWIFFLLYNMLTLLIYFLILKKITLTRGIPLFHISHVKTIDNLYCEKKKCNVNTILQISLDILPTKPHKWFVIDTSKLDISFQDGLKLIFFFYVFKLFVVLM
jgi:hypothetical protein